MRKYDFDSTLCNLKVAGNHIVDMRDKMKENGALTLDLECEYDSALLGLDRIIDILTNINNDFKGVKK